MKKRIFQFSKGLFSVVICAVLLFSMGSCGEEKDNPYAFAANMISWFTDGHFSSYSFKTIEEGTNEYNDTYVYIEADFDDEYGSGTTAGILCVGAGGKKFVHVDDYDIDFQKKYLDSFYQLREDGKTKTYTAEEIEEILNLAKEIYAGK